MDDQPARSARRGPPPAIAVGLELARALGALALLPVRAAAYLARRRRLEAEVREDLKTAAQVADDPALGPPPDRALTVFVACAEPSGEMHAVNLVRALRRRAEERGAPAPRLVGLGGERLAAEGVELVGRPVDRAAMGLSGVLSALPYYLGLVRDAAACLRERGPDLFLPVDSPALHVPLARVARGYGVPTVHFVTPQYWGWAPWRVGAYRRAVDRALTILPFEPAWFARHGVETRHVGHPIRDEWEQLAKPPRSPGESPDGEERPDGEARDLVLLAGSREGVIDRNLPWMLAVAAELRLTHDVPVRVVHERPELAPALERHVRAARAEGWARVETGDLHAALREARAAFSVSGTVLLELLHHRLPAVVLYRLSNRREVLLSRLFLTVPAFSSVNLLAGEEVFPEFSFSGEGPRAEALAALRRALDDDAWRARCRAGLERAAERLGPPGAVDRAAAQALAVARGAVARGAERAQATRPAADAPPSAPDPARCVAPEDAPLGQLS